MKHARSKRILMLLENNPYPVDVRVRREAQALVAAGYDVTVISPRADGQSNYEVLDGVRNYRFAPPPNGLGAWGYVHEYSHAMLATFALSLVVLLRHGFDAVHAHNPPDLYVFIAAFYKLFGKRFVFDHHDLAPEMYYARFPGKGRRLVYRVLLFLEWLSCRVADQVIVTNESYRRLALTRGGVAPERVRIVRNGPNPQTLRPVEPLPTEGRRTIIGYAGVIGFQEGLDYLLRALRHLVVDLKRTDVECIVIGDGDALPSMRKLAAELGLDDHVRFTGWINCAERYGRLLASADICVAPEPSNSYNDRSTMIKTMEYMAVGRPVVAFDLPEHRFTAQDAALYVRPNDELEMARAIALLMNDPARRGRMGAYGRDRIETVLSWSHSVPSLLAAYRALWPPPANLTLDRAAQRDPSERTVAV
jgi:glycosyltransferase involved in cell wall biosynthesis